MRCLLAVERFWLPEDKGVAEPDGNFLSFGVYPRPWFRAGDTRVNTRAVVARAENLAIFRKNSSVSPAMGSFKVAVFAAFTLCSSLLGGCMQSHEAKVQTALLPPPSATPVQHTGRLWVELGNDTWENQCRTPKGQRLLCFDGVRRSTFGALQRSLWTSFPDVALRDGDAVQ